MNWMIVLIVCILMMNRFPERERRRNVERQPGSSVWGYGYFHFSVRCCAVCRMTTSKNATGADMSWQSMRPESASADKKSKRQEKF